MKKLYIVLCVLLIGGGFWGGMYFTTPPTHLNEITETIKWQATELDTVRVYHFKSKYAAAEPLQALAMSVMQIEGVSGIDPSVPYCLMVSMSPLYSWKEVDSRIAVLLDNVINLVEYYKNMPQQPQEGSVRQGRPEGW